MSPGMLNVKSDADSADIIESLDLRERPNFRLTGVDTMQPHEIMALDIESSQGSLGSDNEGGKYAPVQGFESPFMSRKARKINY